MATGGLVQQLSGKLGVEWKAITTAAENSAAKIVDLNSALAKYTTEDTSIVINGSLARAELTSGSDLDWILLVDGIADPAHLEASQAIESYMEEQAVKGPGAEATFGGLVFSHDLIHHIGGSDDTNANLTRRMLLLLESTCLGRDDAYRRVINNVLGRYIREDFGWMHARNPMNIPRFLQNDMARYWRTLAVDFAYKRKKRAGRGWALRTAKLRLPRKLTYAAGLLMCFSCASDALEPSTFRKGDGDLVTLAIDDVEPAALAIVEHIGKYVKMTPLAIFAKLFLENEQLSTAAARMFGAYDAFLSILNDDEQRARLDHLSQADVATDPVYQRVRDLGHEFQGALDSVSSIPRAVLSFTRSPRRTESSDEAFRLLHGCLGPQRFRSSLEDVRWNQRRCDRTVGTPDS